MRKPTSFIVIILCVFFSAIAHAESNRYVVIGSNTAAFKSHVAANGGSIDHDMTYYNGFVAHMSATAAENLQRVFGDAVLVEKDVEVQASGKGGKPTPTPPPAQTTPWGVTAVHAIEAWAVSSGNGALVCVVDTGIQSNHSDLKSNIVGGENFVINRGIVDPANWEDDNGHGTHVSGTIAALDNGFGVVGIAPQAQLFAAKVLDRRGSGYMSDVADGILSCVSHGAQVINMSLGSSSDATLLHDAVITAANAGLVIVAASGNDGGAVSYPAKYDEVVAVSAVDSSLNLAYFSNTGVEVDFAAPGVDVYSTYKGDTYATLSGTSMASPHVAGVAALMVASGSFGLIGDDIGLTMTQQGNGFIDALSTVNYR